MERENLWTWVLGLASAGPRKNRLVHAKPAGFVTWLLLALFLAGGMRGVARADPPRAGDRYTVSGIVSYNGSPISAAEVFVWDPERAAGYVGDLTDARGTYSVSLRAGRYELTFSPPCGEGWAAARVTVVAGPTDRRVNVALPSGYTLSGTVRGPNGQTALGNIALRVFNRDTSEGFALPPTNALGQYCVGLPSAAFDVTFSPPECRGLGPRIETVALRGDTTRDVILPHGFTLGGRITNGAGQAVPRAYIYARSCQTATDYIFGPSDSQGAYRVTLPLGAVGIQVVPPGRQGLGAQTVTGVISETLQCPNTTLDIALPAGFAVYGRVTCEGRPVDKVLVSAKPVDPSLDCSDLDSVRVWTADDGSYALPVVEGRYNVRLEPPQAGWLNPRAFPGQQVNRDVEMNLDYGIAYIPYIGAQHTAP